MMDIEQFYQAALQAIARGDYRAAAVPLQQALSHNPDNPRILALLTHVLSELGLAKDAMELLMAGLTRHPEHPELLVRLAYEKLRQGLLDEALEASDQALAVAMDQPGPAAARAELLMTAGRTEEAIDLLNRSMKTCTPTHPLAIMLGRACLRQGEYEQGVATLEPLVGDDSIHPQAQRTMLFCLGDLLDKQEEYDRAFEFYTQANQLRKTGWPAREYSRSVDELTKNWSSAALRKAPGSGNDTEQPVFILGMPRSGTSLVEQILACHPHIAGGGELAYIRTIVADSLGIASANFGHVLQPGSLRKQKLAKASNWYLSQTAKHYKRAQRLTDKNPLNTDHMGLISLLFPRSRFILCQRDELDTCLSCYFQDFSDMIAYATDLRDLGRFARDQRRLMQHFCTVLEHHILEVSYEALVAEPRKITEQMLQFAGVEMDDRCLSFHESDRVVTTASQDQVNKPIYTSSVARHVHYEKHLEPLRKALAD